MMNYTFCFGNAVVVPWESCSFGYLTSSLCSSHMLQQIPKPWREETVHLCNPTASQQRLIIADVICGDKRECLCPALLTRQRVGWCKRPREGETWSQPALIQVFWTSGCVPLMWSLKAASDCALLHLSPCSRPWWLRAVIWPSLWRK